MNEKLQLVINEKDELNTTFVSILLLEIEKNDNLFDIFENEYVKFPMLLQSDSAFIHMFKEFVSLKSIKAKSFSFSAKIEFSGHSPFDSSEETQTNAFSGETIDKQLKENERKRNKFIKKKKKTNLRTLQFF